MSKKEIVHYNMDSLDSKGADFNILFGERSNGKSYQLKHKKCIEKYLKTGKRFILMRRWREEIASSNIEQYFQDVDVSKLTDGKYNCIVYYRKTLYLGFYDFETTKTKRGEKIGYVVALSTEQNYAGASYLDVEDIVFEEFMTRSVYLSGEPDKLMNFYCTVDRKRGTTRLWLVGNSISRVCPYINEWGLHKIISKQKQGTIETLEVKSTEDDKVKIAIEFCASTGTSSHTIGFHKDMLNDGSWQSNPQPHLPYSYKEYKCLYKIFFQYQSFKFIGEYLKHNGTNETCWFIKPYEGIIKDNQLTFSDTVKISRYWQRDIYNPLINNDKLRSLLYTFRENMIFYATDLVGTDFKQVIDFEIRR